MKMSDVWPNNLIKLPSWFSEKQKKYTLDAISNHDRLTSENARLREALESTINGKQPHDLGTKVPEHLTGLNYTWHFSINDGLFHGYDANGNYVEVTFKNVEPIDSDALMAINLLTEMEKGDE